MVRICFHYFVLTIIYVIVVVTVVVALFSGVPLSLLFLKETKYGFLCRILSVKKKHRNKRLYYCNLPKKELLFKDCISMTRV